MCGNKTNTMGAFFSAVDDKYELDDPGIHLTVGRINSTTMQYEIAASVVGNRRRFKMHYDNLIDATSVEGVTFHENVPSYVDYSTPVYVKPAIRTATANILKRLPPAKENSTTKKTYSSYNDYLKDKYGFGDDFDDSGESWEYRDNWQEKYNDPFYFNDTFVDVTETQNDVPTATEIYPIIDLLEDFLKENRNDSDMLDEMKQQLAAFLIGLELEIAQ